MPEANRHHCVVPGILQGYQIRGSGTSQDIVVLAVDSEETRQGRRIENHREVNHRPDNDKEQEAPVGVPVGTVLKAEIKGNCTRDVLVTRNQEHDRGFVVIANGSDVGDRLIVAPLAALVPGL